MVKLVRGQDNVISLHITSTYPVGEVSGTFVAKSVTIPVPQSRNGTEIKVAAADVEAIGEDFMIGVMTLKNEANEEVAVVRVPLAVLPEGSDNRGFTDVRITLVSIREVEGGDHGGAGVKMFPTKDDFPVQGNVRYIYLAEDTGKMYRWDEATEDYVEVSGVVHANLAENNPEKDGYVLNRQTSFLYNDGWDGTHPYASVANFVPDYDPETTYAKNDVVFHEYETTGGTDNGIFKCLADGTTVAPPDTSKWIEIDLKDLLGKKDVIVSDDGETPTGGEEIWIDEAEIPESQSYNDLVDKPQINGHELTGNKTSRQLGIVDTADLDKKLSKQRVDGDATKGQVEWEELDDHSGCLKVTGVVKGTKVETADGNHNLADKADKATTLAGYGITDAATQIEIAAKADLVDGKVPAAQLPSYVDDVLEYDSVSSFPSPGEAGKIYVAKDTNLTYRWSGTQYVEISPSPALDNTVTEKSPNGVKSSGIWSWVKSLLPKWLTSNYAEPATVASVKLKADKATTLAGYGITDAVPLVEDANNNKTAVTIGSRQDGSSVGIHSIAGGLIVTASGGHSHAEGINTTASEDYSHAEGTGTTASGYGSHAEGDYTTAFGGHSHAEGTGTTASGDYSHTDGIRSETLSGHDYAYAWNGDESRSYNSNGKGTFNINPKDGLNGFFIGERKFSEILSDKSDCASLAPEYSATSAYSVGAIVYYDGNIYQCTTAIAAGGEPWNAEHWELRELEDFFTESNSLLTGTIAAKSIPAFSSSSTYEVGEIVVYDGVAYKCVTAITTADEWTAAHWTLATNSDLAARLKGLKSDGTATDAFVTSLLGKPVAKEAIDEEIIEKGTAPDAHLEAPTDEHLKLILADNSVAYDSAKALPYKFTSVIGNRVIATMTLTAASTDITLPPIAANDTTVKDFILDVTNAYAVEGVATDAGINIPRTDFKLVTRDGESLTDVTTVKAGKSAFLCFTQKAPVVVDGTTYPCWCVTQLPFGDPS